VHNISATGDRLVDVELDRSRVEVGALGEAAVSDYLDGALLEDEGSIVSAGVGSGIDKVVPARQVVNGVVREDGVIVVDTRGGDLWTDGSVALDVDSIRVVAGEADVSARDGEISNSAAHGYMVCDKVAVDEVEERENWIGLGGIRLTFRFVRLSGLGKRGASAGGIYTVFAS
jgi:hypothetical protein